MSLRQDRFKSDDYLASRAKLVDARAFTRPDILEAIGGRTVYPRYAARAEGAYIWDTDGNRYIDYLLGYGPVILGHANKRVNGAASRQLEQGNSFAPLWSPLQVEATELLREVLVGAEAVYLLKTGSDATSTAVRLARIWTGREGVIRFGYNGWHDWAVESRAGIPTDVHRLTVNIKEMSPTLLEQAFSGREDSVACVIMMPFENDITTAAQLKELKNIAHKYGSLFILDEMRSGFRMAIGGAQEYFGIQADLATYSKAMANGHPISAVAGRSDVMRGLAQTRISSTFFADPVQMAATVETIRILQGSDALQRIWQLGSVLQQGLRDLIRDADVDAVVCGYPPMPFVSFQHGATVFRQHFYAKATELGLLLHPEHQWFVSAAHSRADIDLTLTILNDALEYAQRVTKKTEAL